MVSKPAVSMRTFDRGSIFVSDKDCAQDSHVHTVHFSDKKFPKLHFLEEFPYKSAVHFGFTEQDESVSR